MTDLYRPLADFGGAKPPAPRWFSDALAASPMVGHVESDGAEIEYLVWGEVSMPGILLLHGGGAHAYWWAHIAPFFAQTHRVVAMSMAGMGNSSWRETYAIEQHARDMRAVAEAAGLFDGGMPVIAGHSFGGAPTAAAAAAPDQWARLAIIIDSSLDMRHSPDSSRYADRDRRYVESFEAGLARFRFLPGQECDSVYIADMIARRSLVEIEGKGWSWSFDPKNFARTARLDSRSKAIDARCPLAIVWGDRSPIMEDDILPGFKRDLPAGTRFVDIPDSGHHVMVDQPLALVAAIRALIA